MRRRPHTTLFLPLALVGLIGANQHADAEGCYRYEPEVVVVEGTLELKAFAGPPNYKSIEFGDQPEVKWMLKPLQPLCIAALADDRWNIARDSVQMIEIIPRTTFNVSLNGKIAQVQGTLTRAHDGHHHAEILMRATLVAPKQP
jgi:hypothetical protein